MKTNQKFSVGDLMTGNVVTVRDNDLLFDAVSVMEIESVPVVPVVDRDGFLCGILSQSDLLRLTHNLQEDIAVLPIVSPIVRKSLTDALAEDNREQTVANVMTDVVKTIDINASLVEAARELLENEIHHLPIVDSSSKPIGIISTSDIVRAVAYHLED